jgi:proline-specific peptidase
LHLSLLLQTLPLLRLYQLSLHHHIHQLNFSESYLPFSHPSIPVTLNARTWYRIATPRVNATTPKSKDQRPLIVPHGGPGISHLYLRPTFDLFAQITRRTVIYYDQFGGGNSTRYPESKDNDTFWTPELFIDELDRVLSGLLKKGQEYDIYGHSWGGMFGFLYAATRQPKNLNKLILASAPAVMADWSIAAKELLHALHFGVSVEQQVLEADRKGDYMNQTYQDAMAVYNQNYLCSLRDWPKELVDVLSDPDDTVHGTMVGGSDFDITGSLHCEYISIPL